MKRNEASQEYKWDFSHLYVDIEQWKEDLTKLTKIGDEIAKLKGKLHQEEDFYRYLDLEKTLGDVANKLATYTHLSDLDQSATIYQELEGLLVNEFQKLSVKTAFIDPELKEVGSIKVMEFLKNPQYQQYQLGYELFFEEASHILSSHDEELLSKVGLSRGAIGSMYDTLAFADNQVVEIEWKGQKQELTDTLLSEILEDSDPIADQTKRIEAVKTKNLLFDNHKHSFARIYEGILQSETEEINLRDYPSVLEASLSGDSIPKTVYLKLLEVGKRLIKPFIEYNNLLKETFGLEKFYPSDRQLKIVSSYNRTFSVEQAKEIIREALSLLGDEYLTKLDLAWAPNRIDYYEETTKRSGAYSTGGDGIDPIILMNWDDKLNSVNTLAHESGHSVHTLFADESQSQPLNNYPIILAEVASTLNEHILFDYMYKNSQSKEEKIYLLQQRIFEMLSTFYRQIQFADFEYQAHELVQQGIPQTADSLADLFEKTQDEYGYKVFDVLNPDAKMFGWPRISHFFHSPFYVYKYAIDITASYKLYRDLQQGDVTTTLNFLKAGGSKRPLDVMLDSGIDFSQETTYEPLIEAMENYLVELKTLLNS